MPRQPGHAREDRKPITADITRITGIHPAAVDKFGYEPEDVLQIIIGMVEQSDYVIGYNCRRFDYHILSQWCERAGEQLPQRSWIDLYADLPWTTPVGKLSHVAADLASSTCFLTQHSQTHRPCSPYRQNITTNYRGSCQQPRRYSAQPR